MIHEFKYSVFAVAISAIVCGCIPVAAGAGAEAGYVISQDDRTAGETIDDQRITASVKTKLLADPDVSGLDINVDTMRKNVTLKGFVKTGREAVRAIELAQGVSGVRTVQSKLIVDN